MRPKEKGLSNVDIERIINFDWDATDEKSGDEMEDICAVLEKNLKDIVDKGESIEIEYIRTLSRDNVNRNLVLWPRIALKKLIPRH